MKRAVRPVLLSLCLAGVAPADDRLRLAPAGPAADRIADDAVRPLPSTVTTRPAPSITIDPARVLMITDLSVVEDPALTDATTTPPGAWTFRALVEAMAGPRDPADLVLEWLRTWETDQTINGHVVGARAQMRTLVTDPWLARSGGRRLDLAQAPFRLLAIVNRMDLRGSSGYGAGGGAAAPVAARLTAPAVVARPAPRLHAGEGRFVFGVLGPQGEALPFTVIFEYELPAADPAEVLGWARSWAQLNQVPFGARYNRLLARITDRFARAGAAPGKPQGSALNQVRTNENALSRVWELREFVLQSRQASLAPATVKQTPDLAFNQTPELADLVNGNEAALLAGAFVVPGRLLGGSSIVLGVWNAPGIRSAEARHAFALNTCGGCHQAETGTPFLHVGVREPGQAAPLSGFLTGATVPDPVTGQPRRFADLEHRAADLARLLGGAAPAPAPVAGVADGSATLAPAVRVH
ncbi:MAG: hypothetical protein M9894_29795 [Planctomycetes bacterium]|nr:hypothetical protein [Planctomycetota bacterium]